VTRIGVSRCLLGENVRYDGATKRSNAVLALFDGRFEAVPVCPEVEAGLSVPRPPVRLVRVDGRVRALGVEDSALDVTDALEAQARARLAELPPLAGFILKSRSPSCGLKDTPVLDAGADGETRMASGIFATRLRERFPRLPLADEEVIADPRRREEFVRSVETYAAATIYPGADRS